MNYRIIILFIFALCGFKQAQAQDPNDCINALTVCGNANEACPVFPGMVNRYHWGFEDPAHAQGTEEEILEEFRKIRDQIKMVFEAYAAGLKEARPS